MILNLPFSATVDTSFYGAGDGSVQVLRALSPGLAAQASSQARASALSEDTGPAQKRARSSHNVENAGIANDRGTGKTAASGKARNPPATLADIFSSRDNAQAVLRPAKAEPTYRRSSRLRGNSSGTKGQSHVVKVRILREAPVRN